MVADLTLGDILDLRAYERVRDTYRREIIALKQRRRVSLGPIMTLVFECFETVRFQVQEMARVERIATDEGLQAELDVYNRLLPGPSELSATLFIELTTPEDLRRWLPALVGVEGALAVEIDAGNGAGPLRVSSEPESEHAASLTRDTLTPAVHYLRFPFGAAAIAGLSAGSAALVVDHPEYRARTPLGPATVDELRDDLAGRVQRFPLN
jgi:hypothetical protein